MRAQFVGTWRGAWAMGVASVGMFEYRHAFNSHHKRVYRRIDGNTYVYAIAAQRPDFPTLLMKRLLRP